MNRRLLNYILSHPEILDMLGEQLSEDFPDEIVMDFWHPFFRDNRSDFSISSADGSYNHREYVDRILLASMGYALYSRNDGNMNETHDAFVATIRSNLIKPRYRDDFMSLIMSTLELKSLLRITLKNKPDIVLIDGSLRNLISRHSPNAGWFPTDSNRIDEGLKEILEKFEMGDFSSPEEKYGLTGEEYLKNGEFEKFVLSVYVEYLSIISKLIEEAPGYIVGISKTTLSYVKKIIQEVEVDDIILFSYFTRDTAGYSDGKSYTTGESLEETESDWHYKWEILEPFRHLLSVPIYHFYVRFQDGFRVYRVEVVERDGLNVEDIVSMLQSMSVTGYPMSLKMAHREAGITSEDMDILERLMAEKGNRLFSVREGL